MNTGEDTRAIVEAYSSAWMGGDLDTARKWLADDLRFRGSIDHFNRADAFVESLRAFSELVTAVDLLDTFYDVNRAALMYDCVTDTEAGHIRTAEFFRLAGGKISEIRLVFDATVLRQVMGR